jgi:bla regulator protein BlaR1
MTMASWILTQQWLISLVLICLLFNEYKASTYLGGRVSYFMWLLIPLCLIINNLPQEVFVNNNPQIAHYLVSFNEQANIVSQAMSWQVIWSFGAAIVLSLSIYSTIKLHFSCTFTPIEASCLPIEMPSHLAVYESGKIASPMLLGIIKPRLVLPSNYQSQFTASQLQLVLEHEICHFKRFDNFTNFVAVLLLSVCWFNPLAWVGFASFRRSQEIACDHVVLANKDVLQRIEYSKALVNCAIEGQSQLNVYSNYYQRDTMFKRINMLKSYDLISQQAKIGAALSAVILMSTVAWAQPMPMGDSTMEAKNSQRPLMRIEPRYPIKAARGGIEGSVVMRFDINPNGKVSGVEVVKSIPANVFDVEASGALAQWLYSKSETGQKGLLVQLDFVLGNSQVKPVNLMNGIEKIKIIKK